MAEKLYTIPIDCPDGWEPVAFRTPKEGEIAQASDDSGNIVHLIIRRVRPVYQWPDFIPPGWWIAMEETGEWWAYPTMPELSETNGMWMTSLECSGSYELDWLNWTPPEVTDWKQSLMQKPEAK